MDAREPPLHLHREHVRPTHHRTRAATPTTRVGDLKLRRQPAVLRVTDLLAIDPHGARRVHAIQLQEDAPPTPRRRHDKARLVRAHWSGGGGHARRVERERVAHVGVDGLAVARHLPAQRHLDVAPRGCRRVKAHARCDGRRVAHACGVVEGPPARAVPPRAAASLGQSAVRAALAGHTGRAFDTAAHRAGVSGSTHCEVEP
eukprot:scaffold57350_cov69-Phaeocystis_antarctica.AAC.6